MLERETSPYRPVRVLGRALDIIGMLSRAGWSTPREIATSTGIDRATVYRILETLRGEGYVVRRADDRSYFLSSAWRQIGDAVSQNDWLVQLVAPKLSHLLSEVVWPSDFATFFGGEVIIQESTHRFSPLSIHRAMVGRSRPLLRSALGHAMLAGATDDDRARMLAASPEVQGLQPDTVTRTVSQIVQDTRARGYAASVGGTDERISAIAQPLRHGSRVFGAINIMFFRSALAPEKAAEMHLEALSACIAAIEREIADLRPQEQDALATPALHDVDFGGKEGR